MRVVICQNGTMLNAEHISGFTRDGVTIYAHLISGIDPVPIARYTDMAVMLEAYAELRRALTDEGTRVGKHVSSDARTIHFDA